jgi:hypothetical protein
MPKFFFHVRKNGELTEDQEGLELASVDAAREEATASAREMLAETIKMGRGDAPDAIVVQDSGGRQVYDVVLASLLPKSRNS